MSVPTGLPFEYTTRARMTEGLSGVELARVLEERDRQLEDYLARATRGWSEIGHGVESAAASFTVPVPAGVSQVRVSYRLVPSTTAELYVRVNGDATAGLHVRSRSQIAPDGTVAAVLDGTAGTVYFVGAMLALNNWGEVTILDTDRDTVLPYIATHYRQGIPTGTVRTEAWGNLAAARTLTSLVVFPSTGTFTGRWWCEGYRT